MSSCVQGCPDYTCTGPYISDSGNPWCMYDQYGNCTDTIIVRWGGFMDGPYPYGSYIMDLVCTLQISTYDVLCANSGPNSPRNWPPIVNLFYLYQTSPSTGRVLCNAWDKDANVIASGWNSVTGRHYLGVSSIPAGTPSGFNISWQPPTIPNSSGVGAQFFPSKLIQYQTANCSGSGRFPA